MSPLALVPAEADHRHVVGSDEGVELGHEPVVVVGQPGRLRDATGPLEQEPQHSALVLQSRHIAPDADAIHRGAAEAGVLCQ